MNKKRKKMKTKHIGFVIDDRQYEMLQKYCKNRGFNISEGLRNMIEESVTGVIQLNILDEIESQLNEGNIKLFR